MDIETYDAECLLMTLTLMLIVKPEAPLYFDPANSDHERVLHRGLRGFTAAGPFDENLVRFHAVA